MKELPLVFFTVLAQASAGAFILMQLSLSMKKMEQKPADRIALIAFMMVAVAGISALTHLGQPLRAVNALFGMGRSPMSNEIITCAVYAGLVFVYLIAGLKNWLSAGMQTLVGYLAAIAGIVLIVLIPGVYQLDTIPAWSTSFTSVQMVLTALICGGAIVSANNIGGKSWLLTAAATIVLFAFTPSYFSFLAQVDAEIAQQDMLFWGAKYALLALGMVMLIVATRGVQSVRMATLASVFIVVGEIAGRIGFYDLWSIGM